jgi:hypothetical protein
MLPTAGIKISSAVGVTYPAADVLRGLGMTRAALIPGDSANSTLAAAVMAAILRSVTPPPNASSRIPPTRKPTGWIPTEIVRAVPPTRPRISSGEFEARTVT